MFNDTEVGHWEVHLYRGDGASAYLQNVADVHKCTTEEWDRFYEPANSSAFSFGVMKERREMLCIDKMDRKTNETINMKLFGPDDNSPHRRVEIMFMPN